MDVLRKLFFNDVGRLRSGWRLGIFVAVFLLLLLLITTAARLAYLAFLYLAPRLRSVESIADLIFRLVLLLTALGAGYVCARLIEGLPWRSLGLTLHKDWIRDLVIGALIGFGSLVLAVAIGFGAGALRFSFSSGGAARILLTLGVSAVLFMFAALAEEALFRGYPLQTMMRARLAWLGVLLTSVYFAQVHYDNPNGGGWLALGNTMLAGVWLAVAYWRTRSLWFPLGVHWAWNWALGALFGLPVSGTTSITPNPLLTATDFGPVWLTGARYGIEGGIACTIALVISTVFIWRTSLVSPTHDLKRLTSQENPASAGLDTNIPVKSES